VSVERYILLFAKCPIMIGGHMMLDDCIVFWVVFFAFIFLFTHPTSIPEQTGLLYGTQCYWLWYK
jgi:hypothetical protein